MLNSIFDKAGLSLGKKIILTSAVGLLYQASLLFGGLVFLGK
jgi:hypothetical protein